MGEERVQVLMRLLFGEQAGVAQATAGERLRAWSEAFEAWVGELREKRKRYVSQRAVNSWKRLLEQSGKLPWEVGAGEMEAWMEALRAAGLKSSTIRKHHEDVERFYEWCAARGVDARCGAGFNPAKLVKKPRFLRYKEAQYLSAAEARALLEAAAGDDSILSKRDHTFLQMRLRMGAPLPYLLGLRWGQIEIDREGVWITWPAVWMGRRKEAVRQRAPQEAWEAMVDYLRAAGRLEGMRAEDYVFTALKDPLRQAASGQAGEWKEEQAISRSQVSKVVKLFGRRAGIRDDKLTLAALRHTAAMLRVEAGDDARAIQTFLLRPGLDDTRKYLKRLVELPGKQGQELPAGEAERRMEAQKPQELPELRRRPHHKQRLEGLRHGLEAIEQPKEELQRALAERKEGLEDEIEGLRELQGRVYGLLAALQATAEGGDEEALPVALIAQAAEVFSANAARMIKLGQAIKRLDELRRENSILQMWEQLRERMQKIRIPGEEPPMLAPLNPLDYGNPGLLEGCAALRLALGRILALSRLAGPAELLYLARLYGVVSVRLSWLLKDQEKQIETGLQLAWEERSERMRAGVFAAVQEGTLLQEDDAYIWKGEVGETKST